MGRESADVRQNLGRSPRRMTCRSRPDVLASAGDRSEVEPRDNADGFEAGLLGRVGEYDPGVAKLVVVGEFGDRLGGPRP